MWKVAVCAMGKIPATTDGTPLRDDEPHIQLLDRSFPLFSDDEITVLGLVVQLHLAAEREAKFAPVH